MLMDLYWQDVFHQPARFEETPDGAGIVTSEFILEAIELAAGEESVLAFELCQGDTLTFKVSASQTFDILLCSFEDYDRWLDTADSDAEIIVIKAIEDVSSTSITFQAPTRDEIVVIVNNTSRCNSQILVEAQVS